MDDQAGAHESEHPSPASFPLERLEGGVTVVRVAPVEDALPGTLAAFSTRLGGVSSPPWDAMNVGLHVGDSPVDVAENRRRLFGALRVDPDSLVTSGQVHGDNVALAASPGRLAATDGLVTVTRGLTLAVVCADCVPVWLLDPRTPAAGIAHAGWKGTLAEIARRAVETMARKLGSRPRDIVAAVGPSIGPCCYDVGPDVAGAAEKVFGPEVLDESAGRIRLDLWEANRLALIRAGVNPSRVYVSGLCTSCRADLFHSHRRQTHRFLQDGTGSAGGLTDQAPAIRCGRMVALVRLPVLR